MTRPEQSMQKCQLNGSLPDGTCAYTARAERDGFGFVCKKHADRIDSYGDPYAMPLPADSKEPTFEEILSRQARGDYSRNA